MLCGIRLKLDSRSISELDQNPNLDFKSQFGRETGDIETTRIWSEEGITIVIKNANHGIIKGSLHKFKNAGQHNYDDFTWAQVFETINKLSNRIGIDVTYLKILRLECGMNLKCDINPDIILSGLVMHKGTVFKNQYVFPGTHYVCHHEPYDCKCYNKSTQYPNAPKNLLRIEYSANRSRPLNNIGIYTLEDLSSEHHMIMLIELLVFDLWSNIIFIDPKTKRYQTECSKEKLKISRWLNPKFWAESSRLTRSRELKRYTDFRNKNDFSLQEDIELTLSTKVNEMIRLPN